MEKNEESSVLCNGHLSMMKTMNTFLLVFLKQPAVHGTGARRKTVTFIPGACFSTITRLRTQSRWLLRYACLLSSLGVEMWGPDSSFPSDTGIQCSSIALTLSKCHSWLAFPSHWRKYKSLLFSSTTASMHLPETMWTIIPFWKVRRGKKTASQSSSVSQRRRILVKFVLIMKRIIEVMWTGTGKQP